jgi:hypothetical protein
VDEEREGGRRLALRLLKPAERLCVCCNWPNKSGPPSSLHPSRPAVGVAINLALKDRSDYETAIRTVSSVTDVASNESMGSIATI